MTTRHTMKQLTAVAIAMAIAFGWTAPARAFGIDPCQISCYLYVVMCCPKPCPTINPTRAGGFAAAEALVQQLTSATQSQADATGQLALALGAEGARPVPMLGFSALECSPPPAERTSVASLGGRHTDAGRNRETELAEAERSLTRYMIEENDGRIGQLVTEHRRLVQAQRALRASQPGAADWREQMRLLASFRALQVTAQAARRQANAAITRMRAPRISRGSVQNTIWE